jgi:hypothetical protein
MVVKRMCVEGGKHFNHMCTFICPNVQTTALSSLSFFLLYEYNMVHIYTNDMLVTVINNAIKTTPSNHCSSLILFTCVKCMSFIAI